MSSVVFNRGVIYSMKTRLSAVAMATLLLTTALPAYAEVPGVTSEMPYATQGIAVAAHPLAAEAGRKILEQGGNAVDAAAAMQLALNVVEPQMTGIGGGGFMMIYRKQQNDVKIIDSREVAPAMDDPNIFLDENGKPVPFPQRHTTGKAVGVPGTLLGVDTALKKYGTMSLAQVIQPAIDYAENGVDINWAMAGYIHDNVAKLQAKGTPADVFVPNGQPLKEGDHLVQPDLAKTLKLIQQQGPDVLYHGPVGEALVAAVQKYGGKMTMQDLENYKVAEREPVSGTYRGYQVISMSPPSSGGLTVLEILKLLEGYDLKKMGLNSADYLHHFIEASHLAYADRAQYMADEDFHAVPKAGLLDDRFIAERRKLINPTTTGPVKPGDPWKYDPTQGEMKPNTNEETPIGQTTHFCVIDKWGNMVAYTTTIEQVFGSGIMVPGYGFMLNNEMTDFDAVPGGVNQVEPGKRPLSSMSPTLVVKDGKPFMALGSPGGPTIISSVAQTLINVIDFGMPLQDAIYAPRVYSSSYPKVQWEDGISQDVRLDLAGRGHAFDQAPSNIGDVQAAIIDFSTGKMYGGADNTRQGAVRGVDGVNWTATPAPNPPAPAQVPFNLKNNDALLPLLPDQLVLTGGRSYVEQNALLLGLGLRDANMEWKTAAINFDGHSFLPVRALAEEAGYAVSWDAKTSTVLLKKDRPQSSGTDAYSEDKYKITN